MAVQIKVFSLNFPRSVAKNALTDRHPRMFRSHIRLGIRSPTSPRIWHCWWCSGEHHSALCSPASTRHGTAIGLSSPRPIHASCRSAIDPHMHCRCGIKRLIVNRFTNQRFYYSLWLIRKCMHHKASMSQPDMRKKVESQASSFIFLSIIPDYTKLKK